MDADRLRLVSGFDQIKWDTAPSAGNSSHLLGPAKLHTYSRASTSHVQTTIDQHLSLTHIPLLHKHQTNMRFHTQPLYAQTMRYYAQSTRASKADRLGAAVTAGYCCLVFSAPFAGAALVSKNAKKDGRYAKLRPLSFRDCLPCSSLEDYAGVKRLSL